MEIKDILLEALFSVIIFLLGLLIAIAVGKTTEYLLAVLIMFVVALIVAIFI